MKASLSKVFHLGWAVQIGLLMSVPGAELSAKELWKSPTAGFFMSKFF